MCAANLPVRLALIGAGEVAARHVAAARRVGEVRIVAIADVAADRASRLAAAAGAVAYPGLQPLLADADVEVVVLTVPHAYHAELAVQSLTAGRHVLVEKPMAVTVAECDRMVVAAGAAGRLLWVGQQQRQFAQVRTARDILASGELGAPLLYTEHRTNDYSPGRPAWFFDPELAGGGIAMLVGVHTVDRASWLLGAAPVAVAGSTVRPAGWRIETDAAGVIWFDRGPPAHFVLHTDQRFRHLTTVVCERGWLRVDPGGLTVETAGAARRLTDVRPDQEYTMSFARQYRALAATLRAGVPPAVTPAEGRAAVAAVRALYASAERGGVRVELS